MAIITNSDAGIKSNFGIKYMVTGTTIWIVGYEPDCSDNSVLDFTNEYVNQALDKLDDDSEATPITSIRITKDAFKGCSWLTTLILSAKVTHIEADAFMDCLNLETISFATAANLSTIGFGCFRGCTKVTTINNLFFRDEDLTHIAYLFGGLSPMDYEHIPTTLTDVTLQSALHNNCFYKCTSLRTALLSPSTTVIPNAAFYGCLQLSSIGKGENKADLIAGLLDLTGIETVRDEAFYGCNEIDTVYIPFASTPIKFGRDSFKDCFGLVRIYNGTTNTSFERFIVAGSNDYGCIGLYAEEINSRHLGTSNAAFKAQVKPLGSCLQLADGKLLIIHIADSLYDSSSTVLDFSKLLSQYVYEQRKLYFDEQLSNPTQDFGNAFGAITEFPTSLELDQEAYFNNIAKIGITTYSSKELVIRAGLGINNKVDTVILPEKCTKICRYAFQGSGLQTLINLSSTLAYIDANAFSNCLNLHTIQTLTNTWDKIQFNYPLSIYDNLTSIETYNSIANGQLNDLALKVSASGAVSSTQTFNWTVTKSSSSDSTTVPLITNGQFFKQLTLVGGFTEIPSRAFMNCTNLEQLVLSNEATNSITTIGKDAFKGCNKLQYEIKEKNLPDATCGGVKRIGNFIFGCKDDRDKSDDFDGYTTLYIDMSTPATFCDDAFKYCTTLKKVILVGEDAFDNWFTSTFNTAYSNPLYTEDGSPRELYICNSLTDTPTRITNIIFEGSHITAYAGAGLVVDSFEYVKYIDDYKHKQIDKNAFISSSIKKVICLPSMVKAFNNKDLAEIEITANDNDSSIEYNALLNCTKLTNINFNGTQLTSIGFDAFKGCTNISTINFNGHFCSNAGPTWININFENQYSNPMCYCTEKRPTELILDYYTYDSRADYYVKQLKKNNIVGFTGILILGDHTSLKTGGNSKPDFTLNPYVCLNLYKLSAIRFIAALGGVSPLAFIGCVKLTNICHHWASLDCTSLYWIVRRRGANGSYMIRKSDGTLVYGTTGSYTIDEYDSDGVTVLGDNIPSAIGSYAFAGNTHLYSCEIPESVQTIGLGAFEGCTELKTLKIPFLGRQSSYDESYGHLGYIFGASHYNSVDTLAENNLLPKELILTLTGEVNINSHAFYGFRDSISNLYIDGNINRAEGAPLDDLDLEKVLVNAIGITDSNANENYKIVCNGKELNNVPETTQYIYNNAFKGNTNIISFSQSNHPNLGTIGSHAFTDSTLQSINLQGSSKTMYIHDYAFSGCATLSEANLDSNTNLGYVGKRIFNDCHALRTLTIPNTLLAENTHAEAFAGSNDGNAANANGIHSLTMPAWLSSYFGDNGKAKLREVTITAGDTIKPAAFSRCAWLRKVTLPDTIKTIGDQAFMNCISLNQFDWDAITGSCTSIGSKAFKDCWNMYEVTVPTNCLSASTNITYSKWTKHPLKTILETLGNTFVISSLEEKLETYLTNIADDKNSNFTGNAFKFKANTTTNIRFLSNNFCAIIYKYITTDILAQVDCESYTFEANTDYLINFIPYTQFTRYEDSNFIYPTEDNPNPSNLVTPLTRDIDLMIQVKQTDNSWNTIYSTYADTENNNNPTTNDYFTAYRLIAAIRDHKLKFTASSVDSDPCFSGFEINAAYTTDGYPYKYPNKQVKLTDIAGYEFTKTIGKDAFTNCFKLTRVVANGGLETVDMTHFSDCGFDSYVAEDSAKDSPYSTNSNYIIKSSSTLTGWLDTTAESISIDISDLSNITEIAPYTFANRDSLTTVKLPATVTSIGDYAFYSCDVLTTVNGYSTNCIVAASAFEKCPNLTLK